MNASRWLGWAGVGAASSWFVAQTVHEAIKASPDDLASILNDEASINLLSALVGFLPFGALTVAVSIDLIERYAAHFGPEYSSVIVLEDDRRNQLLGLLILNFTAAVVGLGLIAFGQVVPAAAAVLPAIVAVAFVSLLIAHVASRIDLLQPERFRQAVTEVLTRRMLLRRDLVIDWKAPKSAISDYADHTSHVTDFQMLAGLTVQLLSRNRVAEGTQAFVAALAHLRQHAATRRQRNGELSGPVRTRPRPARLGTAAALSLPLWTGSARGPAAPVLVSDELFPGWRQPALWFEDAATEALAWQLRQALAARHFSFLNRAVSAVVRTAESDAGLAKSDEVYRCLLLDPLAALAIADRESIESTEGSNGMGSVLRETVGRALIRQLHWAWDVTGRKSRWTQLRVRRVVDGYLAGVKAIVEAAVIADDDATVATLYEDLTGEKVDTPMSRYRLVSTIRPQGPSIPAPDRDAFRAVPMIANLINNDLLPNLPEPTPQDLPPRSVVKRGRKAKPAGS